MPHLLKDDQSLGLRASPQLPGDLELVQVDDRHRVCAGDGHEGRRAIAREADIAAALPNGQAANVPIGLRVEHIGERVGGVDDDRVAAVAASCSW